MLAEVTVIPEKDITSGCAAAAAPPIVLTKYMTSPWTCKSLRKVLDASTPGDWI
jgi:hypothetical protein